MLWGPFGMLRSAGGLIAFVVLAALPARHAQAEDDDQGSTQVEFAAAQGSGSGFGCGQQTRVHYVQAAVQVRHSERAIDDPRGRGVTLLAGAAVAGSRTTAITEPSYEDWGRPLGDSWGESRFGGHLRLGYWTRYFGVEGGGFVVFFPDASFAAVGLPEGEAWIGRRDLLYLLGGAGVSQLTTQLGYAEPYLGFGCVPTPGLELEALWSRQIGGPAYGDRVDLIWRLRMSRHWAFRGGLALGEFIGQPSYSHEASIGLQFSR